MFTFEEQFQEIKKIIIKLCKDSKAELVWVGDKEGQQLNCHWESIYWAKEEDIDFLIGKDTSNCIDKEIVKINNAIAYIYNADKHLKLVLISSKELDFDSVSLLAKIALNKINKVLEDVTAIIKNRNKEDTEPSSSSGNSNSSNGSNSIFSGIYQYKN